MDAMVDHGIGRIVSLSGDRVIAVLEVKTETDGEDDALQIGGLVKIPGKMTDVFGIVSGLSIPIPGGQDGEDEQRIAELQLIGEAQLSSDSGRREFRRGISESPSLGDPLCPAQADDFAIVYGQPDQASVIIGSIHQERSLPAYALIDNLLGKHFAIVGNTGCGKSCAVSLILHSILEGHRNGHVVLLDAHGEYAAAFGDMAEAIEPQHLLLPFWMFNFSEFVQVVFGAESTNMPTEVALLRELIQSCKQSFAGESDADYPISVDTPVPYKMGDMFKLIDETLGKLENRGDIAPYRRIKNRLMTLQSDRRFSFMFPSSVFVRDNLSELLAKYFRIPSDGKPISILNLSGVPSEIMNVVVSVLARMTFDFSIWAGQSNPILLVCEEAHRYAPEDPDAGFAPAINALSRIAKEGRKYGVSLGVISQRPSEMATSILAQCNTFFAMRMTNQKDQEFVAAAMSEAASGLIDSLPSLGNAEAIAVGDGISVPMRLAFSELPEDKRPHSATSAFAESWADQGTDSQSYVADVVERWRRQGR